MFDSYEIITTLKRDDQGRFVQSGITLIDPNAQKKELSDIEKKFKDAKRMIKNFIKEADTDCNDIRRRIRQHRDFMPSDTEFETNMYRNLTAAQGNKLSGIKEYIKITETEVKLTHAEMKLKIDGKVGGAIADNMSGKDSNVKAMLASEYMTGNPFNTSTVVATGNVGLTPQTQFENILSASDKKNTDEVKEDIITNTVTFESDPVKPESVTENVQKPSNETVNTGNGIVIDAEGNIKYAEEKTININETDPMGMNYNNAANTLKYRNVPTQEIMKYDPTAQKYWIEVRDAEGNVLDDARKKHIVTLGAVDFTGMANKTAKDQYGNSYVLELDNVNNMPEEYKKQWEEYGE